VDVNTGGYACHGLPPVERPVPVGVQGTSDAVQKEILFSHWNSSLDAAKLATTEQAIG
jgi:hypothetical protein